jgi:hypothetical protein
VSGRVRWPQPLALPQVLLANFRAQRAEFSELLQMFQGDTGVVDHLDRASGEDGEETYRHIEGNWYIYYEWTWSKAGFGQIWNH